MATLTEAQLFAACTPDLAPARIPAVVWCSRYGAHQIKCGQPCLQPDGADED